MKSPLKEKPERLPGQSQDEYLNKFVDDKLMYPLVTLALALCVVIIEWGRFFFPLKSAPIFSTIAGVAIIVWCTYRIRRNLLRAGKLKQGRDGERTVGQHLEGLRAIGCSVFHDVQGDNFNLDHVVVCTQGIFTVETKTWSKRSSTETIKFDGTNIIANGYNMISQPIEQSLAQARWLKNILRESTGHDFTVKPVIVFPGWYVDPQSTRLAGTKGIYLVNPKAFSEFLKKMPSLLSAEDVNLISMHIKSYSRSKNF